MSIKDSLAKAHVELLRVYADCGGEKKDKAEIYLKTHLSRYRHDLKSITERLDEGGKVLDLGAAPFLVPYALTLEGYQVVAVDYRPSNWLLGALPFEIVEANCDGELLPFDENAFDCVVFTEVFEHLHINLNLTMKEIHRVLKTGGFLYLTTPNLLGVRGTIRLLKRGCMRSNIYSVWKGAETGDYLGHIREYTPREIAEYLPACGYSEVIVDTVNIYEKAKVETLFWRAISAPFKNGKENIRAVAYK